MTPWIEKYRPNHISEIQLNKNYKKIFDNIVETLFFPNLIFYGPPGTGKTTTILCLLKQIKKRYGFSNNIIHLNASDERGIEVIRNIIYSFVHTNNIMSDNTIKFVVLDEVDSMTITAQNCLISLLNNNKNVKFCLICNYISKLISEIRNCCNILHFYNDIDYKKYLLTIIKHEKIKIKSETIDNIINLYKPDLRCMVNCLESYIYNNLKLINNKDLINICENYSKKYILKYKNDDKKYIFEIIFLYMIENYNIDIQLIDYMEELIYYSDIDYFDEILMKHFIKLQK